MKLRNKPYYVDACGHGEGCFIGSTTYQEVHKGKLVDRHIDVYVWSDSHNKEQHVCIRYGAEDSEYISAGDIKQFLFSAQEGGFLAYNYALGVLQVKGKFVYEVANEKA